MKTMHPVLFQIGSFDVGTYGLLMVLGFLVALVFAVRLAKDDGLAPLAIVDIGLVVLVAGMVGSKLPSVIVDLLGGKPPSEVFGLSMLRASGTVHSGILTAIAAFFWRMRGLRLPVAKTLDALTASVPLAQAIGRLGCVAAGCCYGVYCEMPWAVTFHGHGAVRFGSPPVGVPLHPTQMYFCLSNLTTAAVLLALRRSRRFPGQVAAVYFILEGLFRQVLETWRGDYMRGFWFDTAWLSTGRMTGIIFILIGASIWCRYGVRIPHPAK
jgi:phosphatidylglycerol:prolipoprotein diacylglycerol transferase